MILDKPTKWRRAGAVQSRRTELTDAEQTYVKKALDVLRVRLGTHEKLAEALGVSAARLRSWCTTTGRPTAVAALYSARVARVPVEDVLTGRFPVAGSCPLCGRTDVTEAP